MTGKHPSIINCPQFFHGSPTPVGYFTANLADKHYRIDVGSEVITDSLGSPTALIVGEHIDLPPIEISVPERHLGGITISRQAEAVRSIQAEADEHALPTIRSEKLVRRVRTLLHARQASSRLLGDHVEQSSV